MRIYVGVTDYNWFSFLQEIKPTEANFWRASTRPVFRALKPGELFLFKLHAPRNFIVGGGVFSHYLQIPVSMTWDTFGTATGVASRKELINLVYRQRRITWHDKPDVKLGSIVLANPFFFDETEWLPEPANWEPNIPQGKLYETSTIIGRSLYDDIMERVGDYLGVPNEGGRFLQVQPFDTAPGDGSFNLMLTKLYHSQCAVSGERALPALRVAQIRPTERGGRQSSGNGILMRKDLCELFQLGYITVLPDYTVSISPRLLKETPGGRTLYSALHGRPLTSLPDSFEQWPAQENLLWHGANVYIAD